MIEIESSNLLFFIPASLLLIIAPGPDIVFLITQSITRGPRQGFATAMGLAAGNLVHTLGAALGVSVVFRTSTVAFEVLKFVGVGYLLYLAWKSIRGRWGGGYSAQRNETPGVSGERAASGRFWRGFLMNVLNPKVALFFLALLPQFASPRSGPIWLQMLFYGMVFTGLVVVVFGSIGLVSGTLSRRLGKSGVGARFASAAPWLVAGVYAALAFRLASIQR